MVLAPVRLGDAYHEVVDVGEEGQLLRLGATAVLGIPLFLAVDLWSERRRAGLGLRAALWMVGALGLAAFYVLFARWAEPVRFARVLQAGANRILIKPLRPETLVAEARDLLSAHRP